MDTRGATVRTYMLVMGLIAMGGAGVAAQTAQPTAPSVTDAEAGVLGNEAGPLEPGTYVDASFGPVVRFTVGEDWFVAKPDADDVGFKLTFGGIPAAFLDVVPYDGRYPPQDCLPQGGAGAPGFNAGVPGVDGLAERLSDHQYLIADAPEPAQAGGYAGIRIDATAAVSESCEPRTGLWVVPPYDLLDYEIADGFRGRFIVLDVEGVTMVVVIRTREVDFDRFVEVAMPVVESMTIAPAATNG